MNSSSPRQPILSVKNLSVVTDGIQILDDVSFDLEKGAITAIIGPNGAGKTTLLQALLGLLPYKGTVKWEKKNTRLAYVPQRFSVERDLPLTVLEFFALKRADEESIFSALRAVGMRGDEHHLYHYLLGKRLGVLSGGELQKVSIAWALMGNPDVLLFDEPTAGVDAGSEETIYLHLKRISDERGLTILLISHELNVVYQYVDRVICLNQRMVCHGTPKQVLDNKVLQELYGHHVGLYRHSE